MKEEPYCLRCGADKKQVCRDSSRLSCSAWGTYYGRHLWTDDLWTDAKRQPKATDDAFLPAPPRQISNNNMNFKKWFRLYGINTSLHNSTDNWQRAEIERIAKRAYLRGFKEGKKSISTKVDNPHNYK